MSGLLFCLLSTPLWADNGAENGAENGTEAAATPESTPVQALPGDMLWLSEFVSRAQLTTRVESREPVDQLSPALLRADDATRRIYFFTEIRGLRGEQVRHQWLHQDRVVADLTFPIGADRWRTWSSKLLPPRWIGDWRVRVLAMDGEILAEQRFSYR